MINYFTSAPELFKPSSQQMQQVKGLLTLMHLNLIYAIDIII